MADRFRCHYCGKVNSIQDNYRKTIIDYIERNPHQSKDKIAKWMHDNKISSRPTTLGYIRELELTGKIKNVNKGMSYAYVKA